MASLYDSGDASNLFEDIFDIHNTQYIITENGQVVCLDSVEQQNTRDFQMKDQYNQAAQQFRPAQHVQQTIQHQPTEQPALPTTYDSTFIGGLPLIYGQIDDYLASMNNAFPSGGTATSDLTLMHNHAPNVEQTDVQFTSENETQRDIEQAENDFTTMHDYVPIDEKPDYAIMSAPTTTPTYATEDGAHAWGMYSAAGGSLHAPDREQHQQRTAPLQPLPAGDRAFAELPVRKRGNFDTAQQEIITLRQNRPIAGRIGEINSRSDTVRSNLDRDRSMVLKSAYGTASQGYLRARNGGAVVPEYTLHDPGRSPSNVAQSYTPSSESSNNSALQVTAQSPVLQYKSHNVTSAADAMRIAFGAIGEREQLRCKQSPESSWQKVQSDQHAWAQQFYDVLLACEEESPPIKLDAKGLKMYDNQQNRFMAKLNSLITVQGRDYDSVLPQIHANCYLQVEAVIILHRDGIPKLDFDEADKGSRAQRQKLDLQLTCTARLRQMINAARDLKSIAFDVATGKNQHIFAYNPQSYVNGKLGNIQSNATRKGNKGNNAASVRARDTPSPDNDDAEYIDRRPELSSSRGRTISDHWMPQKRRASGQYSNHGWEGVESGMLAAKRQKYDEM